MNTQKQTNLVKLCVGAESIQSLEDWQTTRAAKSKDGYPRHVTRMWPKQSKELLNGGSLYWVIKGLIQCRQRIVRLDEVTRHDGVRMCAIILDPVVQRVAPAPKRPFQGWRYLKPGDAPPDLREGRESEPTLPPELNQALAEIGVL